MERQDRWGTGRAVVGPPASALVNGYLAKLILPAVIVSNPPALGPNNLGYFGTWVDDKLYKFNYQTGELSGSYANSGEFVTSTPAIYSSSLLVYMTDEPTKGSAIGVDTGTMQSVWTNIVGATSIDERQHSSPTIGPDGNIVASNQAGDVYRWNATTGNEVWHKTGYYWAARPVVFSRDDTSVFVANGNVMSSLDYGNGSLNWSKNYGSGVGAPGVSPNGTVVFGAEDGSIRGVDPFSGKTLWTVTASGAIHGAPAFDNLGNCYVCSLDANLYSIRVSDGHQQWAFPVDSACVTAPSVDTLNRIYFMNSIGNVFCVTSAGAKVWEVALQGESRGPIAIGPDDTLYVGVTNMEHSGLAMIRQAGPYLSAFTLSPTATYGGASITGRVTLSFGASITTVQLSSNSASVTVPASVDVPAGSTSATFVAQSHPVASQTVATLTAQFGSVKITKTVTILPAALHSIKGTTAVGGHDSTVTVSLTGVAAASVSVALSSGNPAVIETPSSVKISGGTASSTFHATTFGVAANTTVTLSATMKGLTRTASVIVVPAL